MNPLSTHAVSTPRDRRRVVGATIIGTTIEWYDFFIYAFLANQVLAPLFFAPLGESAAFMLALASIGLSFLFRPLGAFLAGHFGDKIGRRPMLVITLLAMGVATALIGLLPTYAAAGAIAPVLLLTLRIVQGISAGGEWGGAVLMSVEHAPHGKRGRFGMYPQLGVPLGMLIASGVLAVMRSVAPGEAFAEWGWRVPFLLSVILVVVGIIVRWAVDESPVFQEIAAAKEQQSAPIVEVFRSHAPLVLLLALVFAGNNAVGYMVTGGYIQGMASRPVAEHGLGYDPVGVQLAAIVAATVWLVSTFVSGYLADAIGRRRTYTIGFVLQALACIPLFQFVLSGGVTGVLLGCSLLAIGLGLTYGPQGALYSESFPARVRFSGVSISYAIGAILGGAFAPTIAQWLLDTTGTTWAIVAYLVAMSLIGLGAVRALRERKDVPLGPGTSAHATHAAPVDASAAPADAPAVAADEPKP